MLAQAALNPHHRAPGGVLLAVLILLAILYVAWRTGRLRGLWSLARSRSLRNELRDHRISPLSLLPLAVLVIVLVVLLIAH
jgi:small-conductance mechanosensitive channel